MSDDRTVKTVFLGKPDGRREAGRRKLKWLDSILNCLKSTDEGWKEKADLYGLSFWSRQWLHCKDRTPTKKNEVFIWSACYFRSFLTVNEFSEQILVEIPNRKFHRNPLKLEASCYMQGDGRRQTWRSPYSLFAGDCKRALKVVRYVRRIFYYC